MFKDDDRWGRTRKDAESFLSIEHLVWLVATTKVQTAWPSEDFFVAVQRTSAPGDDTGPEQAGILAHLARRGVDARAASPEGGRAGACEPAASGGRAPFEARPAGGGGPTRGREGRMPFRGGRDRGSLAGAQEESPVLRQ